MEDSAYLKFVLFLVLFPFLGCCLVSPRDVSYGELGSLQPKKEDQSSTLTLRDTISTTVHSMEFDRQRGAIDTSIKPYTKPIRIALMTDHSFDSDYAGKIKKCFYNSSPLDCEYFGNHGELPTSFDTDNFMEAASQAEAVWWQAPSACHMLKHSPWKQKAIVDGSPFKAREDQLAVVLSMQSAAIYKCLDDPAYMAAFDVEMTYRKSSAVPVMYYTPEFVEECKKPLLPLSQKKDAVVFINSNCNTPSNRTAIVAELAKQPGIRVDAMGSCLNSGLPPPTGPSEKKAVLSQYRYCIAMENSMTVDYVTEMVYEALEAGCLPIYLGAPNIREFVPSVDGLLNYPEFGSPAALARELRRLSADNEAYLEKFEWRNHPETWTKAFVDTFITPPQIPSQCRLCQLIAKRQVSAQQVDSTSATRQRAIHYQDVRETFPHDPPALPVRTKRIRVPLLTPEVRERLWGKAAFKNSRRGLPIVRSAMKKRRRRPHH